MIPSLRPATLDDAALMADLHRQCFAQSWNENAFEALLGNAGTFGFLAKTPESTGFGSFIIARVAADEGEILSFGTLPGARRRGLARELLDAVISEMRDRGGHRIFLEVAEDYAAAIELYASSGFFPVGTRPGYYQRGSNLTVTALLLCRDLSARPSA